MICCHFNVFILNIFTKKEYYLYVGNLHIKVFNIKFRLIVGICGCMKHVIMCKYVPGVEHE